MEADKEIVHGNVSGLFLTGLILQILCVVGALVNALLILTLNSAEWESNKGTVLLRLVLDAVVGIVGLVLVLYVTFSKERS